jgi:hypothetical protein
MGENILVFFIYPRTHVTMTFAIDGLDSDAVVLINGKHAWYDSKTGLWNIGINNPWLLDQVHIWAEGYGNAYMGVNPTYNFHAQVDLFPGHFDGSGDPPTTVEAIFASDVDSWDNKFRIQNWDHSGIDIETDLQGEYELLMVFKRLVDVWIPSHGHYHTEWQEYHRVPKFNWTGNFYYEYPDQFHIDHGTVVEFVFFDDGSDFYGNSGMPKRTEDWTIRDYYDQKNSSSGGGGGGSSVPVLVPTTN